MKTLTRLSIFFMLVACVPAIERTPPSTEILDVYKKQTLRTDPGDYAYLYDDLPENLDDLCALIKKQLIHPQEALQKDMEMERIKQDNLCHTVEVILEELLKKDKAGLSSRRTLDNMLVLGCYHHSMLLTSILRYRNIPVRMRAGYARYYEKAYGVRFGHIICEVWNEPEHRWMLVDPDREKIDFSLNKFDFGSQAYLNLKDHEVESKRYISTLGNGLRGTIHLLSLDISFLLHEEKMNWELPNITLNEFSDFQDLEQEQIRVMDQLASLSLDPDANLDQIAMIYSKHPFIQPSDIAYKEWVEMVFEKQ